MAGKKKKRRGGGKLTRIDTSLLTRQAYCVECGKKFQRMLTICGRSTEYHCDSSCALRSRFRVEGRDLATEITRFPSAWYTEFVADYPPPQPGEEWQCVSVSFQTVQVPAVVQ